MLPRLASAAARLPSLIRRELRTRGGDTRFLIWISFLVAFIWARVYVTYIGHNLPTVGVENAIQLGPRTAIFGYHPHHIATGVLFVAVAGFIGLHYGGKTITKIAALLYGTGLGLIVDEIGFIVDGITYRQDIPEVFVLVVTISAFLMTTMYFPSFWQSVETRVLVLYDRLSGWAISLVPRHRPATEPVPVLVVEEPRQ